MLHLVKQVGISTRESKSSLSFRIRGFHTQILAYTLDSLVRVSRRADRDYFVTRVNQKRSYPGPYSGIAHETLTLLPPAPPCPTDSIPGDPHGSLAARRRFRNGTTQGNRTSTPSHRVLPPSTSPYRLLLAISSTFDSLFKVLFTFPSRYLCAIGLPQVCSFGWNLPPASGCTPKQPDSWRPCRTRRTPGCGRGCHPL